jgi:DnaJ-class molecular chaperone
MQELTPAMMAELDRVLNPDPELCPGCGGEGTMAVWSPDICKRAEPSVRCPMCGGTGKSCDVEWTD